VRLNLRGSVWMNPSFEKPGSSPARGGAKARQLSQNDDFNEIQGRGLHVPRFRSRTLGKAF
jgi:hypothetical protein